MAFIQRQLSISFGLNSGTFAATGSAGATFSGLRISAKVVVTGSMSSGGQLQAAVFGLTLAEMNELTTLGMGIQQYFDNSVTLQATDDRGTSTVFTGNVTACWPDMSASPEVCLQVMANIGNAAAGMPIPPTSYAGSTDVATILQGLAKQGGFEFENSGVNVKLKNPYYSGTLRQQIKECIHDAGCYGTIDAHNTLTIVPRNGTRSTGSVSISPQTGMVGYPVPTFQGVIVQAIYQPDARPNGKLTVSGSQLTPANGVFQINSVTHDLESQMPRGKWFTTLQAAGNLTNAGLATETTS